MDKTIRDIISMAIATKETILIDITTKRNHLENTIIIRNYVCTKVVKNFYKCGRSIRKRNSDLISDIKHSEINNIASIKK